MQVFANQMVLHTHDTHFIPLLRPFYQTITDQAKFQLGSLPYVVTNKNNITDVPHKSVLPVSLFKKTKVFFCAFFHSDVFFPGKVFFSTFFIQMCFFFR